MRCVAGRKPGGNALYRGVAAGLAAAGLALAIVGLMPWAWTSVHVVNGAAIPVGVLIGGAVRLSRRDAASSRLPVAAAALTYLVAALAFAYAVANFDGDHTGYVSMADVLARLMAPDLPLLLAMLGLQIAFGFVSIVGGLSLGVGVYTAFAIARGVPTADDGALEFTPDEPPAALGI